MSFRPRLRVVSKLGLLTILPGLIVSSPLSGLLNSTGGNAFTAFAATRPSVLFVDVAVGPLRGGPNNLGVPISIFGKDFGSTRGTSRVTIGGVEVASYLVWGAQNAHNKNLDMIVVQPGAAVTGGAIVVTVNGNASNSDFSFTPNVGNIYYISPSGSDSNPCSETAPCLTVQRSLGSVAQPGDTILVRGGSYAEGEIWIQRATGQSGTEAQPKTLKNYPGEEAYFTNNGRPFYLDADYITISGLNFQNSKALGIPDRVMVGNKIINMTFTGPGVTNAAPVQTHGNNHLVAGNVCEETGNGDTASHCYYISRGDNIKILYNVGSGATGYQLQIYEETRNVPDLQRIISNVLVEGNIFRNSRARSGIIIAIRDSGGYGNYIDGVTIRNNVIYNNSGFGILENLYDIRNVKIYNNTIYQNGSEAIYIANDAGANGVDIRNNIIYQARQISAGSSIRNLSINTNYYYPTPVSIVGASDPNPITGSVQFANPGAFDFHLQAGSAAIDRGLSLAGVTADFDAVPRPQGNAYDLGAFEYPSGGTQPAISVSVTPSSVVLQQGGTQQFNATVSGTTNTAVTWSMSPSVGTLSSAGFYTAPSTVTARTVITVTATSAADPGQSSSATITLEPPVSVSVSPLTATLGQGQNQQFTASVTGTTNTAVTWSLSSPVGTISSTGLYTAPSTISTQQTVVVTATSQADSSKAASATVTLTPPLAASSISVSPQTVSLGPGGTQQFTATSTLSGTTSSAVVTWSLSPAVGTISASGLYTAPSSISTRQTVIVTGTSQSDPNQSASATVTLIPPAQAISVAVSPTTANLGPGGVQQFTAQVSGTNKKNVKWSMSPSFGRLSNTGVYTAPSVITVRRVVTITATSIADRSKSASATVTLNP